MKTFLVGGAVRDKLLGRPVKDEDFVVVGATVQEMLDQGFQQVGADFPVFLHPETKDEYALARTERKTGVGYNGFVCETENVTLEDDLARRDLTINAMAIDSDGVLVDPFGGEQDLKDGILRHVSDAFAEDPVRVLRVARFAARYQFRIAPETLGLMRSLVASGELDHLTPERVWAETEKALTEEIPATFFSVLQAVGALQVVMPWIKTVKTLAGDKPLVLFASLIVEQGMTFADLNEMADALKIPNVFRDVARAALTLKGVSIGTPDALFDAMIACDALRKPLVFQLAVAATMSKPNQERALRALEAARNVSVRSLGIDLDTVDGKTVGRTLQDARRQVVNQSLSN